MRPTANAAVLVLAIVAGSCSRAGSPPLPSDFSGLVHRLGEAQQLARGLDDADLVGTWSGESSRLTTNAVTLKGQVRMRIWPKGQYLQIVQDAEQFVVESGWIDAKAGVWRRRPVAGGEFLAAYSRSNDTLATLDQPGMPPDVLHRSSTDESLVRAEALLKVVATPTASDWARRGLEWARLWQPDAELFAVQLSDPTPEGYIGAGTQLFVDYHSAGAHARLSSAMIARSVVAAAAMPRSWVTKRRAASPMVRRRASSCNKAAMFLA